MHMKALRKEIRAVTFNKGICTSPRVLFGVIKAVSNSSAENSTLIFNKGLNTYTKGKHKLAPKQEQSI